MSRTRVVRFMGRTYTTTYGPEGPRIRDEDPSRREGHGRVTEIVPARNLPTDLYIRQQMHASLTAFIAMNQNHFIDDVADGKVIDPKGWAFTWYRANAGEWDAPG